MLVNQKINIQELISHKTDLENSKFLLEKINFRERTRKITRIQQGYSFNEVKRQLVLFLVLMRDNLKTLCLEINSVDNGLIDWYWINNGSTDISDFIFQEEVKNIII